MKDVRERMVDNWIIMREMFDYMVEMEDESVEKRLEELERFVDGWIDIWESEVLKWYEEEEIEKELKLLRDRNWEELLEMEGWNR